jgi:hypothetical protein
MYRGVMPLMFCVQRLSNLSHLVDFDLVYQVLHEMFDRLLISLGSLER